MTVNDSATTSAEQADQIETLIQEKPDVLVVLPAEGEPLTPVAQKAMDQGIQVINIDREFSTPSAFHTVIGGDNYGIGVQAGNFFADQLQVQGQRRRDPGHRRHLGDRAALARASPTSSRSAARTASRSSPSSRPTSSRTRACR